MSIISSFNITKLIGLLLIGSLPLSACGAIRERLAAQPVKRVTALTADQSCEDTQQEGKRLAGAFLRKSSVAGETHVPVLLNGRNNQNGLRSDFTFNEQAQFREVNDIRVTTFEGAKKAQAVQRDGFGPTGSLPNVYDVSYSTREADFSGPLVMGPGAVTTEIPSSGAATYAGRIGIEVVSTDEEGNTQAAKTTGRFAMQAGYGTGRGNFAASGFDSALPFDTLNWTGLFLCGTRFVSGGQGTITVQAQDGPPLPPFKTGREAPAFNALFESTQFAPVERLSPPVAIGGVFVIQSDSGTITAVFLSDRTEAQDETETQDEDE